MKHYCLGSRRVAAVFAGRAAVERCGAGTRGLPAGALSAWPMISYRNRLGMVSRGLPHFIRVSDSERLSRS